MTWKTRIWILINVPTALCLQQFDKFWIWSLCNDRKRKLFEFAETCLEKTREITSSRLIYLRCLILQATVGDGFQELAGSNQAFVMTHSYSAGPKKRNSLNWLITLMPATVWQILNTNIEGACNDRKRKFDQIKLLGWLTHTLLGLKKKKVRFSMLFH